MLAIQSFKHCPEKYKQQNKGNMKLGGKQVFFFLSHLLCLALNERLIQMSFNTILIHIKWRIRLNKYDDLHFLFSWYDVHHLMERIILLIFIQIIIILRTDHLLVRHEIHRETDDVRVLQAAPKTSVWKPPHTPRWCWFHYNLFQTVSWTHRWSFQAFINLSTENIHQIYTLLFPVADARHGFNLTKAK